jgi:regulator of protease activity HflC (stomatin/prohibitin superfamily)
MFNRIIKRSLHTNINTNTNVVSKLTGIEHVLRVVVGMPLFFCGGYTVRKNHVVIVEYFGKYYDTKKEGLRFNLPYGVRTPTIFMGLRTSTIKDAKIIDKAGNPIILSALVVWKVFDPVKYTYNIQETDFIITQSDIVLKQIMLEYTYDELRSKSRHINDFAKDILQRKVEIGGYYIESLDITDINYAPEIAQQMLIAQQVNAKLSARKSIVDAAVNFSRDVIEQTRDLNLSRETQNEIVRNLITVISSDNGTTNVINLNRR